MSLQTETFSSALAAQDSAINSRVLEIVADRVRGSGVHLAFVSAAGEIRYHDEKSGAFFQQFFIPALQLREISDAIDAAALGLTASSEIASWKLSAGMRIALAPFVEKRQIAGALLIAARAEDFSLG